MQEIEWKAIPGIEYYEASSDGQIRSLSRFHKIGLDGFIRDGCIIRPRKDKDGYCLVEIHQDGVRLTRKVHRLVAMAFIDNPNNYPLVMHIDDNPSNNHVLNLKWGTHKHNQDDASLKGSLSAGREHLRKLSDDDVRKIREHIANGMGNTAIGKLFGVTCGAIYAIRINKSYRHIK